MTQTIEPDLQKLWKSIDFNLSKEIPSLRYQYKHLGYDFPQIFSTLKSDLLIMIQNVFYQFMIARFGHLFNFHNEQIIIMSDKAIKQVYNKIFVLLEYGKKEKTNTLFVVVAVIVAKITEKVFPDIVYNQRLTIQIMHCITFCSLGVMVGDNAMKYLIGKELGHRQMTRFLLRKMFEQKIIIAKIKEIQEDNEWPQLKKLFYVPPPPPPQKLPFDNDPPPMEQQPGFIRSLNTYNIKSIQMSRAFLHQNKQFLVKQNSLKKYPRKMNISLQCTSPFYKQIKKSRPITPVKTHCEQKKQATTNKKNLKYWQQYISKFKNNTQKVSKQKFPPIIPNQQIIIQPLPHDVLIDKLKLHEDKNKSVSTIKPSLKYENIKPQKKNYHSFHESKQLKQTPNKSEVSSVKISHYQKHSKQPSQTTKVKNQSKQFYKNRLQLQDQYEQALRKQFHKLNLIR